MAKELGRYDTSLQMFVETPKEPDLKRLIFLRKLAETRRLEHDVAGSPSGEIAARAVLMYMMPIEAIVREGIPNRDISKDLKKHMAEKGDY